MAVLLATSDHVDDIDTRTLDALLQLSAAECDDNGALVAAAVDAALSSCDDVSSTQSHLPTHAALALLAERLQRDVFDAFVGDCDATTPLSAAVRESLAFTLLGVDGAAGATGDTASLWWTRSETVRSLVGALVLSVCWRQSASQRLRAPVERLVDCAVSEGTQSPLPALLVAVLLSLGADDAELLSAMRGALPLVLARLRECPRVPPRPARIILQMCCRLSRSSPVFLRQLDDANGHQLVVEQCFMRAAPHDELAAAAMLVSLLAVCVPRVADDVLCARKFLDAVMVLVPSISDVALLRRAVAAIDLVSAVSPAMFVTLRAPFVGVLALPQTMVAQMLPSLLGVLARHVASEGLLARAELQLLCALCTVERPCCVIRIADFVAVQIEARRLTPVAVRDVNLLVLLLAVLESGVLAPTSAVRTDADDVAAARAIIDRDRSFGELPSDDDAVRTVLVALTFDALLAATRDSVRSLGVLREAVGTMSTVLTRTVWRRRALRLFARLSAPELQCEARLVAELVLKLQSTGGIATVTDATIEYRLDLLGALRAQFEHGSAVGQEQFRRHGGLAWLVSALSGLAAAYEAMIAPPPESASGSSSSEHDDDDGERVVSPPIGAGSGVSDELKDVLVRYACALLSAVAGAVRGHAANALYLNHDIQLDTLMEPLTRLQLSRDAHVALITDALVALAVDGARIRDGGVLHHLVRLFARSASVDAMYSIVARIDDFAAAHADNVAALGDADMLPLLLQSFRDVLSARESKAISLADLKQYEPLPGGADDEHAAPRRLRGRLFALVARLLQFVGRPRELRAIVAMLREPQHAPQLLKCIGDLFGAATAPSVSVRFGDAGCARGFETERTIKLSWPPAAGYCVAFWMCVHDLGARSNVLIAIEPIKASATAATLATSLTLEPDGRIAVFALDAAHVFDFRVTVGLWQLVAVVHSAPAAAGDVPAVQLYVDGNFVGRAAVPLPPSSNAPLILRLGDCGGDVFDGAPVWSVGAAFVFGDESDAYPRVDESAMVRSDSIDWSDENAIDAISAAARRRVKAGGGGGGCMGVAELRLLRALGPDYAGDFRLDAQRLPAVRAHAERSSVSIEHAAVICWRLRAALMVAFSARQGGVAAQRMRVPSGLAGGGAGLLAPFAVLAQPLGSPLRQQKRAVAREQLEGVGGVGVLLLAAVSACDETRRIGALRALRLALHGIDGARALRAFEATRGFELLVRAAETDRWPLTPALMGELFEFAGVSSEPDADGLFTAGMFVSEAAVRHLLLSWSLWRLASGDVFVRLLRSLAGLAAPLHRHRAVNVRMLRAAHAPTALLHAMQSDEPPNGTAGRYVQLVLHRLTIDPLAAGDVPHLVAKFLVATQPENAAAAEPRVVANDDGARASTRPHLRHCMLALLVDMQLEFDDAGGDHSLLAVVDFRTTIGLLRYASLPFQMTLVRLIGLLLRRSEAAMTFHADDCYALMASVLRDTDAPLCLFRQLFDIMIGRRRDDDATVDVSGTTWYARRSYAAAKSASSELFGERVDSLARPDMVLTIMWLLSARDVVPLHCRVSVLKALHSVFLQCDRIKLQLLEVDFALLLSEVIDSEARLLLEHTAPASGDSLDASVPADASSPSLAKQLSFEDDAELHGLPLDVALQIARAVVVFGCEAHSDARLLATLIDSLHAIGQHPNRLTEQLQLRVTADALQFYRDNPACASNGSLGNAFSAIIDEACSYVCWQPRFDSPSAFVISAATTAATTATTTAVSVPPASPRSGDAASATVRRLPFGARQAWRRMNTRSSTLPAPRDDGDDEQEPTDESVSLPNSSSSAVLLTDSNSASSVASPAAAAIAVDDADERGLDALRTRSDVALLLIDALAELSLDRADSDRVLLRILTYACEQRADERLFRHALRTLATPALAAKRTVTRLLQQRAFTFDVLALTAEAVAAHAKARAAGAVDAAGAGDRVGALADALWRSIERLHEAKPGDGSFGDELARQRASPFAAGGGALRASVLNDAAAHAVQRDAQRDKWRAKRRAQLVAFATAALARSARQRDATRRLIAKANAFRVVQLRPFERRTALIAARQRTLERQFDSVRAALTHERAVWVDRDALAAVRWQLDPTEGFNRCRIRLMRIERERMSFFLDERLVMPISADLESEDTNDERQHIHLDDGDASAAAAASASASGGLVAVPASPSAPSTPSSVAVAPASSAASTPASQASAAGHATPSAMSRVQPGDRIEFSVPCELVTINAVRSGEFLLGARNAYFIDAQLLQDEGERGDGAARVSQHSHVTWPYSGIRELHRRRRLLRDTAFEIFLVGGRTHLVGFATRAVRDGVYERLVSGNRLPARVDYEAKVAGGLLRDSITTLWQRGELSNFAYLMHLNTLAGRTFNDLTQYPVFPFVLSEGSASVELDLTRAELFRDLAKPMGAQDAERLARFVDRYEQLCDMEGETPYHYGSHYSNSGSVLHFLVRLEPFATQFVEFQGGRFDVPDRAFHRVAQTWRLSAATSSSDVKELIPEFFYLPEFLCNANRFDLGVKQSGDRVDDVELPPWARGDARRFVRMHREALECAHVSAHLHEWIDLIFGFKQRGAPALAAINVFHPLTYEGAVDVDAIDDPVMRTATIAQISSYGQTPKQLFTKPHVKRRVRDSVPTASTAPDRLACYPMWAMAGAVGDIALRPNAAPIVVGEHRLLLRPTLAQFVSWNNWDRQVRVCALDSKQVMLTASLTDADDVLCAASASRGGVDVGVDGERSFFLTGGSACLVRAWRCVPDADDSVVDLRASEIADAAADAADAAAGDDTQSIVAGSATAATAAAVAAEDAGLLKRLSTSVLPPPSLAVAAASVASRTSGVAAAAASAAAAAGMPYVGALAPMSHTAASLAALAVGSTARVALVATLHGHEAPVTALRTSSEWSVIVSGDADGCVIVWDLNRLAYVRTLPAPATRALVCAVSISLPHGDIYVATIDRSDRHRARSVVRLFSINGVAVASSTLAGRATCMDLSAIDHASGNVVAVGMEDGAVHVLDAETLLERRVLRSERTASITAIAVTADASAIVVGDQEGLLMRWSVSRPSEVLQI